MTTESRLTTGVRTRLSVMMFLEFFIWGAYLVPMGKYLANIFAGNTTITGNAYSTNSIAAIISPFLIGLVADRFFPGQIVMGVLHLVGGVLLLALTRVTDPGLFFWLLLAYSVCFMPTLALVNSVSFDQLDHPEKQFPGIRVLGTIGWIVAGLMVGFVLPKFCTTVKDVGATNIPFLMAGIVSLVLGVYSFTLPNSPAKSRGQKVSLGKLLGLDALVLMRKPSFALFVACSFLLCIPLAMYYGWANRFISETGVSLTLGRVVLKSEAVMTFGQMSEIVFMLLMPLFLARFGVKTMLAVGMTAWAARYFLFSYGSSSAGFWMLYGAIILHGICYDFFFVTGQLYTDHVAPTSLRASAQGLIALITYGAGMYVGNMTGAFIEGRTTLAQKTGGATLDWHGLWLVPAVMATVILVLFLVSFHDKVRLGVTKKETSA